MTTLLMSSFCVFLWILNVLKAMAEDQVSLDFVTILTASCRASCLDEFVPALSTVENCQKNHDCSMCSQICRMVHEDLHMWKPMCTNKDICFPGCRKACTRIEHLKDIRSTSTSKITIHSFYDPVRHLVKLIWSPVTEGAGSIFYVILLKNRLSQNRTWTEFAQTTSCTMHIKPELLSRHTDMRIMAANSNGQIADTVISYSHSLLSDRSNLIESKDAISNENGKDLLSILKHRLKNARK